MKSLARVFFIRSIMLFSLVAVPLGFSTPAAEAQIRTLETDNLRLIYYGISHEYLVRHVARSFENSLAFHREMFGYTPSEKINVLLFDDSDFYNAGAGVIPRNLITVSIAPADYTLEILPSNERLNFAMHHELMHIVTGDNAAGSEKVFRALFVGKVPPTSEDPESMLYSYLSSPRFYSPRWYKEGIAVFMETWMAGGMGRALSWYDEMVFRTKVRDGSYLYDMVGLESEGTSIDFQSGSNSYLYGTRFISYLALTYGPEKVVTWSSRPPGSKGYINAAFKDAFGLSITQAWSEWIEWERGFQEENLRTIRQSETTTYRPLEDRALGSVSRGRFDPKNQILYVAVNYPGQLAHIAAIDGETGTMRNITDLKGARRNSVSSLALDPDSQALFYTTDDATGYRDLHSLNVVTGQSRLLLKDARIGDLAFNSADRSIWGVRHHLGLSSLVRIPYPYTDYDLVFSWPYGQDLYDIDISPDGEHLTGALLEINGHHKLIRTEIDAQLDGRHDYETIFDFDISNPEGFTYSADGRYMFGSSYFSGVSNIFRYNVEEDLMEVLTNAETGFFRPSPVSDDSLIVFRYSNEGYTPVMIANASPTGVVKRIWHLGDEIAERHRIVEEWKANDPNTVDLEPKITYEGDYHPLAHVGVESIYPVVQGYKDYAALGLRINVADFIRLHSLQVTTTYSPSESLPKDERLHASFRYGYRSVTVDGNYNGADFYDLVGPRKSSRKGYGLGVQLRKRLLVDEPRTMNWSIRAAGYGGLERLPGYQNIKSSSAELYTAGTTLSYEHLRNSLGAIDKEKGISWSLNARANYVNNELYPRISADYHLAVPMPISHTSLWLHASAGKSFGDIAEPAANFYFGGFRNNWIDDRDEKQFHEAIAFPGLEIDAIGGTNYAKLITELVLPPLRFRRLGGTNMFIKWLRLSGFTSGLVTNFDRDFEPQDTNRRKRALNVGGQVDIRMVFFSYFRTTLSFGYAAARERDGKTQYETMVSLKIL